MTHPYAEALREFRRNYFVSLLTETRGCVLEAAVLSGYERTHLYRVLRELELYPSRFRVRK